MRIGITGSNSIIRNSVRCVL
ncbi:UNVERIFIED_CONTAM: hypothetical protein GTU68_054705 [Idotea baltica]|nr:hypothetical protein [Idotea baltica]